MDRQKRLVSVLVMVATSATLAHAQPSQTPSCRETVVTGRVQQGQAFEAAFAQDLLFRLEPETHPNNPGGWTIQITPASDLQSDYLMVATPPYRFSNPRYVNTGYGITAEAALSWAHREFAFVAEAHDYDTAREALSVLLWSGTHTPDEVVRAQAAMEELPTYPGSFLIEDGATTPPDAQRPLGEIDWIRFRVELCVPERLGE